MPPGTNPQRFELWHSRRIVSALEAAAALRYSRRTHRQHPAPARAYARWLLVLGHRLSRRTGRRAGAALAQVWGAHVLPYLVDRTSVMPSR